MLNAEPWQAQRKGFGAPTDCLLTNTLIHIDKAPIFHVLLLSHFVQANRDRVVAGQKR